MDADNKAAIDKGVLQVIDNLVDQTTGTVRLKAEFPNRDMALWPGAFANVRLLVDTLRDVIVVPTAAVQRGPKGTFVYVVKPDETVTVRPVTVTQQDDTQAVVTTGLESGEPVVTTGFARLAEGTQVKVAEPEPLPEPNAQAPVSRRQQRQNNQAGQGQRGGGQRQQPGGSQPAGQPAVQTPGAPAPIGQGPGQAGAALPGAVLPAARPGPAVPSAVLPGGGGTRAEAATPSTPAQSAAQ